MKRLHLSFHLHVNSLLARSREEAVNYNRDTGKENHRTVSHLETPSNVSRYFGDRHP
jgi:hypothetical protein